MLTEEERQRLIEKHDRSLHRRWSGAAAAVVGYDFQEMVSIVEVLKLAGAYLATLEQDEEPDPVHVEQNARVGVDDLVVKKSKLYRHLQIKAEEEPSWRKSLVAPFLSDIDAYGSVEGIDLVLELWVGSRANEAKMISNLPTPELSDVVVRHLDRGLLDSPFADPAIQEILMPLYLSSVHDLTFSQMWSDIWGGWRMSQRRGELATIFGIIQQVSRYTITSLSVCPNELRPIVEQLNDIDELYFAADAHILVITHAQGHAIVPMVELYEWENFLRLMDRGVPGTLEEFYAVTGSGKFERHRRQD